LKRPHAQRSRPVAPADDVTIDAMIEAGSAAVSAGAVEVGLGSLRTAARLADQAHVPELRIRARLVLAETLIHSLGGLDEQGLATLVEADEIALADDRPDAAAHARAELGYVDFLRARYDRAEVWLNGALEFADGSPSTTAKATTYLGAVASDRANYPLAIRLLDDASALLTRCRRTTSRIIRPRHAGTRPPPSRRPRRRYRPPRCGDRVG
jgi:tetratricopeptide (TPR) repeat protein